MLVIKAWFTVYGDLTMATKSIRRTAVHHVLFLVLALVFASSSYAFTQEYDVYPEAMCAGSGMDTECLTLSDVMEDSNKYFASNTTLVFHDGEHILQEGVLTVTNITNFTMQGYSGSLPAATMIVCSNSSLSFSDMWNLKILSLSFNYCSFNVTRVTATFQNGKFNNGTAPNGGALAAYNSTVHFDGDHIFVHNTAGGYGGAIYMTWSNITFSGGKTKFAKNCADNGGAMAAQEQSFLSFIGDVCFSNNTVVFSGGAVFAEDTNTLILNEASVFSGNMAYKGGAVHIETGNTLSFSNHSYFLQNLAGFGGAVHAESDNAVRFNGNTSFLRNTAFKGGALLAENVNGVSFDGNTSFLGNRAYHGGALLAENGNAVRFSGSTGFMSNIARSNGGAVLVRNRNNVSFFEHCHFVMNTATDGGGGAVHAGNENVVSFAGTISFTSNVAGYSGGAVYAERSNYLNFMEHSSFMNNTANTTGGAVIFVLYNTVNFVGNTRFLSNVARVDFGGAIYTGYLNVLSFNGASSFISNAAVYGGAVLASFTNTMIFMGSSVFTKNSAGDQGGAILAGEDNTMDFSGNNTFIGNAAEYGGAFNVEKCNLTFSGCTSFMNNTARYNGGGVYLRSSSNIRFIKDTIIEANVASLGLGGGGFLEESNIDSIGNLVVASNQAQHAGGLHVKDCSITTRGHASFTDNMALQDGFGGAIFAFGRVRLEGAFVFANNKAGSGGGIGFNGINGGYIVVARSSKVSFEGNKARRRGGAIYVEDNPITFCAFDETTRNSVDGICFLQNIDDIEACSGPPIPQDQYTTHVNVTFEFVSNTAVEAGDTVYGGHLESCAVCVWDFVRFDIGSHIIQTVHESNVETFTQVASDPFKLCFCEINNRPNCNLRGDNLSLFPGQTLTTSVVAVGQTNGTVPSVIRALSQNLTNPPDFRITQPADQKDECNQLQYPMHSTVSEGSLTLYSDEPCSTLGDPLTFSITFLPCPVGFALSEDGTCTCDQRLEWYTQNCSIRALTFTRQRQETFWVGFEESERLILHPHCPFDYCIDNSTTFTTNSSDMQCASGRAGVLCGACESGHSLALGSSRCLHDCSNKYLALLPAFALTGVVLVVFLFFCSFTVAKGVLGGLIFYANVLAINRTVFFPSGDQNVLTVFIAWLNLDLGIETCFFVSLDAYYRTWLQFAFPIYIWVLVGMIIVLADRSTFFARVIGNTNPVAVLATLFLLSYTKLLRAIMAAFSFTTLDYPDGDNKYVWLYDGNLEYLDGDDARHVILFIFSFLFFVLVFLPYTLLLLCSQWILKKTWWMSSTKQLYLKSFLDAYGAPYKQAHRYWVGLLLLLRFLMLFVTTIIDINNPQDPFSNLMVVLLVSVTVLAWLARGVYKKWYLDMLEASFSFNLIILVGGTYQVRLSGGDQAAVVYTSTGIAFTIFIGIVVCTIVQRFKEKYPKHYDKTTSWFPHKVRNRGNITVPLDTAPEASIGVSHVSHSSLEIVNTEETSGHLDLRPALSEQQ